MGNSFWLCREPKEWQSTPVNGLFKELYFLLFNSGLLLTDIRGILDHSQRNSIHKVFLVEESCKQTHSAKTEYWDYQTERVNETFSCSPVGIGNDNKVSKPRHWAPDWILTDKRPSCEMRLRSRAPSSYLHWQRGAARDQLKGFLGNKEESLTSSQYRWWHSRWLTH